MRIVHWLRIVRPLPPPAIVISVCILFRLPADWKLVLEYWRTVEQDTALDEVVSAMSEIDQYVQRALPCLPLPVCVSTELRCEHRNGRARDETGVERQGTSLHGWDVSKVFERTSGVGTNDLEAQSVTCFPRA